MSAHRTRGPNSEAPVWGDNAALSPSESFLGKDFPTFSLVQNTDHASSRTQSRLMGKVIYLLSHLSPYRISMTLLIPVFSEQGRLLKSKLLIIFPDSSGFPSGAILDPFMLSDLTTSHGSLPADGFRA